MTLLQFALWHRFFVESVTPTLPEVTDPPHITFSLNPRHDGLQRKRQPVCTPAHAGRPHDAAAILHKAGLSLLYQCSSDLSVTQVPRLNCHNPE